jgi:hypothetical protein
MKNIRKCAYIQLFKTPKSEIERAARIKEQYLKIKNKK